MKKRMLTMLLALMLIVSVIPFAASAATKPCKTHDYDTSSPVEIVKAATCTERGIVRYKCKKCDETKKFNVDALGHLPVDVPETPATCTTSKKTAGVKCSRPGCTNPNLSGCELVPNTYLNHDYNNGKITTAAKCGVAGVKTFTCKREGCDATKTEEVAALSHSWQTVGYTEGNEATCSKTGEFLKKCEHCGLETTTEAPKVECEFVPMDEVAPKCGVAGSTGGLQCKWCGGVKEAPQEVAALRHDYDEGVVTTAPKCGVAGVKTITCKREGCGSYYTESVAALRHDYDEGVVTTAPKCGVAGVKTITCKREGCGSYYTESVAALTHEYDSSVTKAATCTKAGEMTYVCKHCGLTVKEEIKATGHKITNDMATLIGEQESPDAGS